MEIVLWKCTKIAMRNYSTITIAKTYFRKYTKYMVIIIAS